MDMGADSNQHDQTRANPPLSRPLKCLYMNARSICDKIDCLEATLSDKAEADLILISETFLTPDHPDSLFNRFSNYTLLRSDRIGRSHGGVAALVRVDLDPEVIDTFSNDGVCEGLWFKISSVLFGVIYRSPSSKITFKC